MDEYKLDEWPESLHGELSKFNATVRDASIQGIFSLFHYNFQWCFRLPFVLSKVYFSGWMHGKADAKARREILGHDREIINENHEGPYVELTPELREIEKRIAARRDEINEDRTATFMIPFPDGEAFQQLVSLLQPGVRSEVATLFPMQVVFAWAAFETLAGDLWTRAVNAHPDVLAELAGSETRIYKKARGHKPDSSGDQSGKKRNAISLAAVKRASGNTYDLRGCMGTLLASDKKTTCLFFTSLDEIRSAYSRAFPDNVDGVKSDEIDDALANKQLDALSLVRNLLVHRSGRADQHYIDDSAGIPDAPQLMLDSSIRIDGRMAREFVRFAYNGAVGLTRGVDLWITRMRARKAT